MKMNPLGRTDIQVSRICLGTMTFGEQTSEADAHAQLDLAWDFGVNFLDTAEMYSFPARAETQGASEEIVGEWMRARGNRDRVVVATKITPPAERMAHIRGGDLRYGRRQIAEAVDNSLKRLQTDYIDLYQTHWPERPANYFGKLDYVHDPDTLWTPIEETLEGLQRQVEAGKIRAIGVSNETAWGMSAHLRAADARSLPRIASIQNPYNLLCRHFEIGMSEIAIREDCGLLAYSPLGFGALTGKHLSGAPDPKSRRALFPQFTRYFKANGVMATEDYVKIARGAGLDPAQMALAYVNSRPFLTANIIGARTIEQLEINLASEYLELSSDVLSAIEGVHTENPNPAP